MSPRIPRLMVLVGFGLWLAGIPRSFGLPSIGGLTDTDLSVTVIGASAAVGVALAGIAYLAIGIRRGRRLASVAAGFLFVATAFLALPLSTLSFAAHAAFVAMAFSATALALEGYGRVRALMIASAVACVLMAVAVGGPGMAPMPVLLEISGTLVGILWLVAAALELFSAEENPAGIPATS
jgi:hypothetical protein